MISFARGLFWVIWFFGSQIVSTLFLLDVKIHFQTKGGEGERERERGREKQCFKQRKVSNMIFLIGREKKYKFENKNKQMRQVRGFHKGGPQSQSRYHILKCSVSGRWLPSSICTISQGGSHQADERREFECKSGLRGSEQLWKLPSPRAAAFGLPRLPSPHWCLVLAGAGPAWALGAYKDSGCVWQHNSFPARRPGPRTDSWKSLRPPMTPFKASSVWLFDFWLTFAGEGGTNAGLKTMLIRSDYSQGKTFQNNKQNKIKTPKHWCASGTE